MNGLVKKLKSFAEDGLLNSNPILIQVLGTCPTLAVSTTVFNGVGMGLSVTAVLIFSNLLISLLRNIIPKQIRIASYVVVISGFVTAVEMLLKAYIHTLDDSLGVFIPLIVVNCIILARAEAFASKNPPIDSMLDGLFMGLGFTMALIIMSSVREIIGSGTFLGKQIMFSSYSPVKIFIYPAGAFIVLGCVMAAFKKIVEQLNKRRKER